MQRIWSILIFGLVLAGCSSPSPQSQATPAPGDSASAATDAAPSAPATGPASAMPSTAASASAAATPTTAVNFSDLSGVFGADKIIALAQLGVFDAPSGAFNPAGSITRREFVRWLYKANNAIYANNDSKQFRPASSGDQSSFKDVATTDPDFPYIQGLQTAGVSVGFPDKTFRPDQPITREQALAIKDQLDEGGVDPGDIREPKQALYELPDWKDKAAIGIEYVPAINTEMFHDCAHVDNVGRVFGAVSALKPKQPMTRSQVAILIWKVGDHSTEGCTARTASDALAPSPTPSP